MPAYPSSIAARRSVKRARGLRERATRSERIVWEALRRSPHGLKFRRQHPVGPFIADFACPAASLIIELDGSGHAEPATMAKDAHRTAWLEAQGWTVIRFWNPADKDETTGLIDAIVAAVGARR